VERGTPEWFAQVQRNDTEMTKFLKETVFAEHGAFTEQDQFTRFGYRGDLGLVVVAVPILHNLGWLCATGTLLLQRSMQGELSDAMHQLQSKIHSALANQSVSVSVGKFKSSISQARKLALELQPAEMLMREAEDPNFRHGGVMIRLLGLLMGMQYKRYRWSAKHAFQLRAGGVLAITTMHNFSNMLGGVKLKTAGPDGKKSRSHTRRIYAQDIVCATRARGNRFVDSLCPVAGKTGRRCTRGHVTLCQQSTRSILRHHLGRRA